MSDAKVVHISGYTRRVQSGTALYGLTGYAQSGKDTFAAGLEGWTRVALADKVREVVEAIDPWIPIQIAEQKGVPILGKEPVKLTKLFRLSELLAEKDRVHGTSKADGCGRAAWNEVKQIPEVRRLLQRCGTEGGRMVLGENVWIDAALPLDGKYDHIVVTDVRFPNEAQRVKDLGGVVIRVVHPERKSAEFAHPSELKIDEIQPDLVVDNDGTIEELREKARLLS